MRSVASDLGLHSLAVFHKKDDMLKWVKYILNTRQITRLLTVMNPPKYYKKNYATPLNILYQIVDVVQLDVILNLL